MVMKEKIFIIVMTNNMPGISARYKYCCEKKKQRKNREKSKKYYDDDKERLQKKTKNKNKVNKEGYLRKTK